MTDEEQLLAALLQVDQEPGEVFSMLEIVAMLQEMGAQYRAQRDRELVPA